MRPLQKREREGGGVSERGVVYERREVRRVVYLSTLAINTQLHQCENKASAKMAGLLAMRAIP